MKTLVVPIKFYLAASLFVFFFKNGTAQNQFETTALNRIILTKKDTLVEFYTVKPTKKIKTDFSKNYYWYRADTILVTQNGYDGKLLHGSYKSFYPNKNLNETGNFNLGTKDGTWKSWHANGQMKTMEAWKNGELHGKFEEYDVDGKVIRSGSYKNGMFRGYTLEYKGDSVINRTKYRDNEPVIKKPKKVKKKTTNPKPSNSKGEVTQ